MSEFLSLSPEQNLLDALYSLQAYRQISCQDPEPAVFGGEIHPECSVFKDRNTGDRIVVTALPLDDADFTGASVWLSNPEQGVEVRTEKWQASPPDVIFWIDEALRVIYHNPSTGAKVRGFPTQTLAERIDFPRIYPIPQSEQDPRSIPNEIESLYTPQTDTYTLSSRIFDTNLENNLSVFARCYGVVGQEQGEAMAFDLSIYETMPSSKSLRSDEFDREFILGLDLGAETALTVRPWGRPQTILVGRSFKIKVVREGMLISSLQNGREVMCIPTKETEQFIDSVLLSASQNQSNS